MLKPTLAVTMTVTASRFSRTAVLASRNDVSSVTWRVASMLATYGPLRPSQIAARERTSRATTTAVLQRMEVEGLIIRTVDPYDARAFLVELSANGQRELNQWRRELGERIDPLVAELSEKDRKTLVRAEQIMSELIEKMEQRASSKV